MKNLLENLAEKISALEQKQLTVNKDSFEDLTAFIEETIPVYTQFRAFEQIMRGINPRGSLVSSLSDYLPTLSECIQFAGLIEKLSQRILRIADQSDAEINKFRKPAGSSLLSALVDHARAKQAQQAQQAQQDQPGVSFMMKKGWFAKLSPEPTEPPKTTMEPTEFKFQVR